MNLKYYLKENLPPRLYHILAVAYKQRELFRYWIPYVFGNGKALAPTGINLEVTFHCNQKCLMCPQAIERHHDNSHLLEKLRTLRELTTEEICSLVNEAARMKVKIFCITGGEAFLRKDIVEIIRHVKRKKIHCHVISNGTLIGKELAKEIVSAKLDRIIFSLDGPEEIHNKIRNSKNAFSNLMQTVGYLKEEKKIRKTNIPHLSFSCTISAINSGNLSQLMDVAALNDMDMHFGYLFYTTDEMRKRTNDIVKMEDAKDEDQDVAEFLKKVDVEKMQVELKKIEQIEKTIGVKATFAPPLKDDEIYRHFYDDTYSYTNKCFYPWHKVRVSPYGEVYPCSMNILMGNIRDENFSKIWNNEKYVDFRRSLKKNKLFPKCAKCCVLNNKLWSYLPGF